ncbi:MAG TPA: efflux RND transporter periplasmic adaptor subunit [Planctomycetes bacterium]|nr:efflux RND transporter periplasmic adaptor subunit [Planctomycetota bacterium]
MADIEKSERSLLSSRNVVLLLLVVVLIIAAFIAGRLIPTKPADSDSAGSTEADTPKITQWTCSMHPQIRRPKPGKCPICFMDLIPVNGDSGQIGDRQISFSANALKLMEIRTNPVERKFAEARIRMVGKIDYDESRIKYITAWTPGRIDRLYVDYTGIRVKKGDHMVYLYSPDLLSAQGELIQAAKSAQNISPDSSEIINRSILATLDAAREKLRLLGLTPQQIEDIEQSGKPVDHLTIYAPIGGIVINKNATEGMYVQTGTRIYTIADLSKLWVKLDAYESDISWIRYGQQVEFTTEAYPGRVFKGRISFIDPILDAKTRTVKLRVNVDNSDGVLKPGMFVRAVAGAKVAGAGRIMDTAMAGKWICPMHPDVVKDSPGPCDICQMPLQTAESLGYATIDESAKAPLVVPASAPLITGKRAVVYVQVPGVTRPTYQGREVVLGPKAGDYYIVQSGLTEGEIVVTNGNFKIDSALQIQAGPSMMSAVGPSRGGETIEQKTCPVMGGPINKDIFIDYKGKKVYFCCPGCESRFRENPEKYIPRLPQFE